MRENISQMMDAQSEQTWTAMSRNFYNPFPQQRCFCLDCEDGCALVRCRLVVQELQQGFFGVNILKQKTLGEGESRTMMATQITSTWTYESMSSGHGVSNESST